MKYKNVLALMFLLSPLFCYSQIGDISVNYHQVAQLEGREQVLKNFLSPINPKSDTVYVFLFQPMMCPRCEFEINIWFRLLAEIAPEVETALIAVYPNKEMGEQYLAMRGFEQKNTLVDTSDVYKQLFAFSTGEPRVTYLLKIDRKNGRLILGGDFQKINPVTVKELYEYKEPLPFYKDQWVESLPGKSKITGGMAKQVEPRHIITLEQTHSNPISVPTFPKTALNRLSFTDELFNKIYLYSLDTVKSSFINSFEVSRDEEMMFVDTMVVSRIKFEQMKNNYEVLAMCLTSQPLLDTCDGVSFSVSLPRLVADEEPDAIAYYNKAAIVLCNTNGKNRRLYPMTFLSQNYNSEDIIFTSHEGYLYLPVQELFLFRIEKGWPGLGLVEKDKKDIPVQQNSFLDSFYDSSMVFALYDKNGLPIKRFCLLDTEYKHTKTGYSYVSPKMYATQDTIAVTCGTSGLIHLYKAENTDTPFLSIRVFTPQIGLEIDRSLEYKIEYLSQFEETFSNNIQDLMVTNSSVYCLSSENGLLFFKQYNLEGTLIKEKLVGSEINGISFQETGLYNINSDVGAYGLFKDGKEVKIALY